MPAVTRAARPWREISAAIAGVRAAEPAGLGHERFVDLLWERLAPTGVSWLGIYLAEPASGPARELVLGARRDKPACSPIGLHGVCGRGFLEGRAIVVEDVTSLGEAYVACDPRDRSEVVVPLRDADGVWGVLDLDSHEAGAFSDEDVEGLARAIEAAGLRRHT